MWSKPRILDIRRALVCVVTGKVDSLINELLTTFADGFQHRLLNGPVCKVSPLNRFAQAFAFQTGQGKMCPALLERNVIPVAEQGSPGDGSDRVQRADARSTSGI